MTRPTVDEVMRLATAYAGRYGTCPYDLMVEAREKLCAAIESLIAAPAAPQQAEPVAQIGWADEFGNLFPMGAWKPAQRTHHDSHKTAWRAVYLHPPAAEAAPTGPRTPDPTMVICPACTSQFTATPESVQAEVQRLRDALEQIEHEANQPYIQRIAAAALEGGA